jgi:predicted DsbA family dithiol-disulfide isomerase
VLDLKPSTSLVTLDFWADLACPWCYVGSRRLALAVAHEPDGSVLTRWRSYQVHPGLPESGAEAFSLADLVGGPAEAAAVKERVTAVGREVGIHFDQARLEVAPDTSLAQRAVLLYGGEPRQRAVSAALYSAHFERGLDITDVDVVSAVAADAADDSEEAVRRRLDAGEGETELAADLLEARVLGVAAVPTYVVGRRIAVQGAQEVEIIRALIAEGRSLAS